MSELPPLKDYQDEAIDFALSKPGVNIFARPGKGKTRIALETIYHTNVKTLVLAPLFPALTVWPNEIKKWGFDFDYRVLHGKEKKLGGEQVSIINYDALVWLSEQDLSDYEYVIYDEVSKMKNPGSSRFRRWRKLMSSFKYRLGLTGTPVGNNLMDLWGEMYCVDLGESLTTAKYKYQREYFYPHYSIKNYFIPKEGAKEDIFAAIKNNAMSLDFYDNELPELILNPVPIPLSEDARRYYNELKKESVIAEDDVLAVNAGVRSQKLRQVAAGTVYNTRKEKIEIHDHKRKMLKDLIDELQGDPVLVFFEFKHDLYNIRNILNSDIPSLDGNTKPQDMVKIVDDWNAGKIPVLAAHPKTAGMGGNMQGSGDNIIWYTMPWSLESFEQGNGRIWRQGKTRDVIVHCLLVNDTKDEEVFDAVFSKKETQDDLFNTLERK